MQSAALLWVRHKAPASHLLRPLVSPSGGWSSPTAFPNSSSLLRHMKRHGVWIASLKSPWEEVRMTLLKTPGLL